jgi:hypothetical protein
VRDQAANQKRYRHRRHNEILVLRCPVQHDVILDLLHYAGIRVPDPSRETLEDCLQQFIVMFEEGRLSVVPAAERDEIESPP